MKYLTLSLNYKRQKWSVKYFQNEKKITLTLASTLATPFPLKTVGTPVWYMSIKSSLTQEYCNTALSLAKVFPSNLKC